MANNSENLQKKAKEILDYAKNEGFSIFYSKELDDYDYDIFNWDESKDWKEFFTIARNEAVKIIVTHINTFDSSNKELIKTVQSRMEGETKSEDGELDFTKYNGQVGLYQFLWVKDGIKYALSEMTRWYQELKEIESALETEYKQQGRMAFRTEFTQERQGKVPEFLKSKSEEDITTEIVEFIEKESPNATDIEVYTLMRLFWSDKGLFDHGINTQTEVVKRRIEMKAQRMFDQKQAKKEKEIMPQLVQECVSWSRKTGLMKLTLGEIGAFVAENDLILSREGQRLLWQKANIELKTK